MGLKSKHRKYAVVKNRSNRLKRGGVPYTRKSKSKISRLTAHEESMKSEAYATKGNDAAEKAERAAEEARKLLRLIRVVSKKATDYEKKMETPDEYGEYVEQDAVTDGEGVLAFHNGYYYFGEIRDGKANGIGKLKNDGVNYVYEGEWVNNAKHGFGIRTFPDNQNISLEWKYEGEWKNDMPDGKGIFTYPNRDVYEGEFSEDIFSGYAILKYNARRGVYKGQFADDRKNGYGTYEEPDRLFYSGKFKNDKLVFGSGKAVLSYGVYTGDFKDEQMNGKGVIAYNDGDVYEGEFKNNKKYGAGKLTMSDGTVRKGNWFGDKFEGTITYPDGITEHVKHINSRPITRKEEEGLSGDETPGS